MTFSYQQLQEENKEWVAKNFGETTPDLAWRPLMGMCEELSELMAAPNREEVEDCVADFVVFLSDYCNARGYVLQQLWDTRFPLPESNGSMAFGQMPSRLLHMIGKTQHHHLKSFQNIRGSEDHHDEAIRQMIRCMLSELDALLSIRSKQSMLEVVEKTWLVVRERDWNKHRKEANAEGK